MTDIGKLVAAPAASQRYVAELDGIRALAVGAVVIAHYGLRFIVPGGFGVTVFFFLSGYLITTLFFAEYHDSARISIPQFYLRRWLRLTPPLIISVFLGVVFYRITRTGVGATPVPIGTTLSALFYFTNYYDLYHGMAMAFILPFGIYWSLAVEEHFYLIWPWLVRRGIRDPRRLLRLIVGVCIAVLVWRCFARFGLGVSADYTYTATDSRIDSILYGALLRTVFETSWSAAAVRYLRLPAVQIAAVLALVATFAIRDDDFRETVRYSVQGVALMPIFTMVLTGDPNTLARRALAWAPMVLIGRLSYTIYLFHGMGTAPGEAYFGQSHTILLAITGVLLTAAVSYAVYVLVDRPIAGLRHRLRDKSPAGILARARSRQDAGQHHPAG